MMMMMMMMVVLMRHEMKRVKMKDGLNVGHLANDVRLLNTLPRAKYCWTWGADINGGWSVQNSDSRRPSGLWRELSYHLRIEFFGLTHPYKTGF
ncbi:hypothetical protein A2U01_0042197 [Trifolium medium]|uniref:Uncharacterized protein n=1 Tax=Trifolium medium TaxID=97028 RepID=A0A392Q9G8_9FABA|nr:hypothetical protein [Trifolium medium]